MPAEPKPPKHPFTKEQVAKFVLAFPTNPVSSEIVSAPHKLVVDLASSLYQYMLILRETIYRVPSAEQKLYFNQSLHMSMIWILDKYIQAMRAVKTPAGDHVLAPTFENISLGSRAQAFGTLKDLAQAVQKACAELPWYTADLQYYVPMIEELPDVSDYWKDDDKFAGAPSFPAQPPASIPDGAVRHACMGLNHCKGQGRTLSNSCAGQGACSTALQWNPADAGKPSVSDHQCHVRNDCRGQGGCGLYGTAAEQNDPGHNACRSLGSCATPINAERFSTDGPNRGKSVWHRAREVFKDKVWASLRKADPSLPPEPPRVPGSTNDPELFANGPTIEWIENEGGGMTACGASGLSGAGSCA